jgi:hypothetical protein
MLLGPEIGMREYTDARLFGTFGVPLKVYPGIKWVLCSYSLLSPTFSSRFIFLYSYYSYRRPRFMESASMASMRVPFWPHCVSLLYSRPNFVLALPSTLVYPPLN